MNKVDVNIKKVIEKEIEIGIAEVRGKGKFDFVVNAVYFYAYSIKTCIKIVLMFSMFLRNIEGLRQYFFGVKREKNIVSSCMKLSIKQKKYVRNVGQTRTKLD